MMSKRSKTATAVRQKVKTGSRLIMLPKCEQREQRDSDEQRSMDIYLSCDRSDQLELFSLIPTILYNSTEKSTCTIYTLQQAKLLAPFTLALYITQTLHTYTMSSSPWSLMSQVDLIPIIFGENRLSHFILDTALDFRREKHSMNLWRYVLSQYVFLSPDSDEGNHDGSTPWVTTQGAAIGLHVAASDSSQDILAAEDAAFKAVHLHMLAASVQTAWVLTAHGSRAKLWSYMNTGLVLDRATFRAVFPRSNARGEASTYIDIIDNAPEWARLFGLVRARAFPNLRFLRQLYSDQLVDFLVDPTYALQVTHLEPQAPDADTLTGYLQSGELVTLPGPSAWYQASVRVGHETERCYAYTAPSESHSRANFIITYDRSGVVNPAGRWRDDVDRRRYWTWTLPFEVSRTRR